MYSTVLMMDRNLLGVATNAVLFMRIDAFEEIQKIKLTYWSTHFTFMN